MDNAIYLCVDRKFFSCARLCLQSLKVNYPNHPDLLIFWKGLDSKRLSYLKSFEKVFLFPIEEGESLRGSLIPAHRSFSVDSDVVLFRYSLWSNRFDAYDKILHLDVDTLITGPLDEIFEKEENFVLVNEPAYSRIFKDEGKAELNQRLLEDHIELSGKQGNGGVFVIARKMRTQAQLDKICRLHKTYKDDVRWADQSIINLWMMQNDITLSDDYRFNYCIRYHPAYGSQFLRNTIKIIHFNGLTDTHVLRLSLMWTYLRLFRYSNRIEPFLRFAFRIVRKSRRSPLFQRFLERLTRTYFNAQKIL